jgi:cytochrome c oxidase assembly factor CtaG
MFVVAALAMVAGASGQLSPLLSTALWLSSMVALACYPSSPVRRAVERGLHISSDRP